jgi:galactose-1-phosphate uridylyltransferase
LFLKKDAEGGFEAYEATDLEDTEIGEFRAHESELAMLLSEQDVEDLAETIEPGSSAAVLVWENTWAAPFGAAVRHSGGQLVASGRIPIQAVLAATAADDEEGV